MSRISERRTTRRYDLSLPVLIRVPAERRPEKQLGKTRDVSTRGVYFVINANVEAGSKLDLTMTLPTELPQGSEVLVRASGRILRVEPRVEEGESRKGVAAAIERYDIIRSEGKKN